MFLGIKLKQLKTILMNKKRKKLRVLDLFSGCGGLSFGFEQAGYEIIAGIDNWEDALLTFAKNHQNSKVITADLGLENPQTIIEKNNIYPGLVDVVIGGPPCQGFSISGKRNPEDPRNKLYKAFVDFVKILKPKAFVMENVPNLVSMDNGKIKEVILSDFESCGYHVEFKILKASNFGVPQNRRRVFFVGLQNGKRFEFPEGDFGNMDNPLITVVDAISDLPESSLPDGSSYAVSSQSEYQKIMRLGSRGVYNHENIVHKEKTKEIIAMVPDGGNYKNLPINLRKTRNVHIAWTRLNSKKPSYTIDTGHNHIFHYVFNRVPTARESARIQSFPDRFILLGKNKASHLKQVGNAVPPLLASIIAKKLIGYIK